MDIGSILIGLAALLLVAFWLSQPLLDGRGRRESKLNEADQLSEQRDRILATLRDLDFDHASSKIQEQDYTTLRAKLVAEGAAVLKRLDELAPAAPSALDVRVEQAIAAARHRPARPASTDDADLEAAIAARRRGAAAPAAAADEAEQAIASARRKARASAASREAGFCPQCGQPALAGDKFCAKCGASLAAPSTKDSA